MEGNLTDFDESEFIDDMAYILEIDPRTIDVISTASGSIIVIFRIYDTSTTSSVDVTDHLNQLISDNDPSLSEAGIDVIEVSIDNSNAAGQDEGSSGGLSTGGIVAIAVIVPIAAIALVGIGFFAYKKKNEGGRSGKNTVEMKSIDNKKQKDEETGTGTSTSDSESDEDSSDETSDSDESSDSDSETGSSESGSESGSSSGSTASSSESGTSESSN